MESDFKLKVLCHQAAQNRHGKNFRSVCKLKEILLISAKNTARLLIRETKSQETYHVDTGESSDLPQAARQQTPCTAPTCTGSGRRDVICATTSAWPPRLLFTGTKSRYVLALLQIVLLYMYIVALVKTFLAQITAQVCLGRPV